MKLIQIFRLDHSLSNSRNSNSNNNPISKSLFLRQANNSRLLQPLLHQLLNLRLHLTGLRSFGISNNDFYCFVMQLNAHMKMVDAQSLRIALE
jgi:hypothetical protein